METSKGLRKNKVVESPRRRQPAGTLGEDGLFARPFVMFGFSVTGDETSINGVSGQNCYLALNWVPAEIQSFQVDPLYLEFV